MDEVPVRPGDDEHCDTCRHLDASEVVRTRYCPKHGLILEPEATNGVWCLAWERRESHAG